MSLRVESLDAETSPEVVNVQARAQIATAPAGSRSYRDELLANRRLRGQLLRLAARRTHNLADAEDVLQSALLRALERTSPQVSDTDWSAWLIVVVRRLTIDLARHGQRWAMVAGYDPNQLAACAQEPDADWMGVSSEELACALAELDTQHPCYRQAYELYYERQLSYKQIAQALEVPVCTVATRLHRVRKQLRSALERARSSLVPAYAAE